MKIDLATLRGLDAHNTAATDLRDHLTELDSEANGQALTAEQRADFEETTKFLVDELEPVIAELEARASTLKAIAGDERNVERSSFPVPNVRTTPEDIFDLASYRQRVNSIDDLPAAYIEGAHRAIDAATFPTIERAKAQERVTDLLGRVYGEPGDAARQILATGSARYMRAWGKYISSGPQALTQEEARALQTGSDANGGVAIPFTIDPTFILTSDGAANPFRDLGRVIPITTKAWQPVTTAGVTAAYGTETAATTDAAPTDFAGDEITPVEVKVTVKFTATYGEDYGLAALQGEVGRLIQDAKDTLEAEKFPLGTGSNQPQGVVWKIIDDGTSIVPASAFDLDAIDELTGELPERFQSGASIAGHRKIFTKIRQLGTAGAPANSIYDPIAGTLYGYPRRISSFMDGTSGPGDEPLLIGDFSYFVIIDRLGLTTEFVPHMVDGSGELTGQRAIFARWRNTSRVLTVNAFRLLQLY